MWRIRPVQSRDASGIAAIYAPIVERTIISFEEVPPSAAEMESRIARLSGRFPWLVAEQGGDIVGYAYAGPHRERAAYRWSVDMSAYVHERARRLGVATSMYRAILTLLVAQGYCHAFAGITMPNDASVALHRSIGFEPVGIYKNVGFKFGAWRDTSWWQRPIGMPQGVPP
jgi:L-amino acid N-acyltransferase YncA